MGKEKIVKNGRGGEGGEIIFNRDIKFHLRSNASVIAVRQNYGISINSAFL